MKTAMLTVCPGADVPLAPWPGAATPCSVHGFGRAIGADVWEGMRLSPEVTEALPTYDVVVVNSNTEMFRALPEIADVLRGSGSTLAMLQEGDARVWEAGPPERTMAWMRGASQCDVLLMLNAEHAGQWEAMTNVPVREVRLPRPADAHRHRVPWTERGHAVYTGSGVIDGRGGIASLVAARAVSSTAAVYTRLTHYDDCMKREGAEEVAGAFDALVRPWLTRGEFLQELARCRLAVNLDPNHSYGRFAADCEVLGVPCVGLASMAMQRELWPGLTLREDEPVDPWHRWRMYLENPRLAVEACAEASRRASGQTAEAVLGAFEEIVAEIR